MLTERRHDIDALRVIVLFLLIGYHAAVAFQPWGWDIAFISNDKSLESLWIFFSLINTWRIPILFVISGMALRYAYEKRDKWTLFNERTKIILLPYYFGINTVTILHIGLFFSYIGVELDESIESDPAHLWFLANIAFYAFCSIPFLHIVKNGSAQFSKVLNLRFGTLFLSLPWVVYGFLQESLKLAWGLGWTMYAGSLHGFILGLMCFHYGIVLVSQGEVFWESLKRNMPIHLALGIGLYIYRLFGEFELQGGPLVAFESYNFIFGVLGLGQKYLNKQSSTLDYLKEAVFPVYIFHLPLQQFFATLIFPTNLPAYLKFFFLIVLTLFGSFTLFHVVKRIKILRPLYGLRNPPAEAKNMFIAKSAKIFYYCLAALLVIEILFLYGIFTLIYMSPG